MQFIGAEGHLGKMDRAMLRRVVVDDGDTPSTSCLSAFLHYGEISARDVWQGLQGAHVSEVARAAWARQLGFREYSRYLTFHYPFTRERSLLENLRALPWCHDQNLFKAWRQGRTGYPIVDAGMRELNATGWIHNSIRVLCASFLVKYLLLPWQWGLKYFWDSLLDADIESDVLGWQYIAGCLPDGVPFDELPDPHAEGLKLDPQGRYVRRWVPELKLYGQPNVVVALAANKVDLEQYRVVSAHEGQAYAHENELTYLEPSIKAFMQLCKTFKMRDWLWVQWLWVKRKLQLIVPWNMLSRETLLVESCGKNKRLDTSLLNSNQKLQQRVIWFMGLQIKLDLALMLLKKYQ